MFDAALVAIVSLAAIFPGIAWKFGEIHQRNAQGQMIESLWLIVLWPIYRLIGSFVLQFVAVKSIKRAAFRLLLIPIWGFLSYMTPYASYGHIISISQGEIENPLNEKMLAVSLMAIPTGAIVGAISAWWWRYRHKASSAVQFSLSDMFVFMAALAIWFASLKVIWLVDNRTLDELRRFSERQMQQSAD